MTGGQPWLVAGLLAGAAALLAGPETGSRRLRRVIESGLPGRRLTGHRLGALWHRITQARGRPAATQATAAAVVQLVEALAAELRAGQPPPVALATVAAEAPVLGARVVAATRAAGPVADLLDAAADAPGAAGLHAVAACWRVAEQSGGGLARGLDRVARGLRDEQQVAREVSGQLAGPRATGLLLAGLPLFGLLLGSALGADPVRVLLGTSIGWACLAVGVPLQAAGWWWVHRLAAAVDPWRR